MKYPILIITLFAAALSAAAADLSGNSRQERLLIKEGNELFRADKYHEALQRYENALTINPQSTVAQYNKAVTLVQLATDDNKGTQNDPRAQAAQLFQDIARVNSRPDLTASSFYNLGNMAYNDEDYDRAIEMYKGSLRTEPDNRRARQNLLLAMKKKEEQEQNKDNQEQDNQEQDKQEQEQQQQQQQQQQEQQQQQQEQQQQPMTRNAEQILQSMQNKENATRQKVNRREAQPAGRSTTDKPW